MGQRGEKYARRIESRVQSVESRMESLEQRQMDSDRYISALQDLSNRYQDVLRSKRVQTRIEVADVRKQAAQWKLNAILTMVLLFLVAACCIIYVSALEPEFPQNGPAIQTIPDDGSLPGDDVPAAEPEQVEAAENELIEAALLARAIRLDDVTVTHYDVCVECCGKTDGITASGVRATPGVTVAVDPDVIPLGADVLVDYGDGEIQYCRADDTGGAIHGNHIDLCVETHQEALQLGRRTATVWWVMP